MTRPEPWWANNPALQEIRRRTAEEFALEVDGREPIGSSNDPDPVMAEVLGGTCRRELADARDGLARARRRYDDAVLSAREVGFSWGEIANVLGVSRQQLHRRFSCRSQGTGGRPRG